jgi:glycosyltransferase involved in cell wall biosynthesis
MACATPVVGYAVGSVAESVVHEVTGRLVTPGDERELAISLRRMVTDGTERFAYANAAVDRVRCRYTWDRTAAALERVYERAVDRRRPSA